MAALAFGLEFERLIGLLKTPETTRCLGVILVLHGMHQLQSARLPLLDEVAHELFGDGPGVPVSQPL